MLDQPLQQLLAEPAALTTQSHHLTASLTSLTHTSYPVFLALHQSTNALARALQSLDSSLHLLLGSTLPALDAAAAAWNDRTDGLLNERSRARLVLDKHDKLRDLLDVPQLIDTSVRNAYFADALSLVSHANALASPSSPPILASVLSDVHHSLLQMLLLLLATLHEPNRKLPALYKAVNFLRKLDLFGPSSPLASRLHTQAFARHVSAEQQLALAFLTGRDEFLKSILDPSSKDLLRITHLPSLDEREQDDLARYLKSYIDRWREAVYDIVTQYTTIFLDKNSPAAQSLLPSTSDAQVSDWFHLHALISTYASRALATHLLPILSQTLPCLSSNHFPSLLTQVTYCSTAFARLGLEFKSLLLSLFSHAVDLMVKRNMQSVTDKFVANFHLPSTIDPSSRKWEQPSKWLLVSVPSQTTSPPIPVTPLLSQGPPHIPPQILASYPPVAEYTNALLNILNGLRLMAPTSILSSLAQSLDDDVLFKSAQVVLPYIKAYCSEHQPTSNGTATVDGSEENENVYQKRVIMAFGHVFFNVFVPFMRRALVEGVYSSNLDANFQGGNLLPGVVMDWEDFASENTEVDEESGEASEDDDEPE